jgi:hypothetical protein
VDREKPPILIFCVACGGMAIGGAGLVLAWLFPSGMAPDVAMVLRWLLWFVVGLSLTVAFCILPDEPDWWRPLSWIVYPLRRLCYGPFGYVALVTFAAVIGGALVLAGKIWWRFG